MSEWQPIETAPKDGVKFLATVRVYSAHTGKLQYHQMDVISVDPETGEIDLDDDRGWPLEAYEFWMPLPKPPTLTAPTPPPQP